jgi:3-hydroxybutyryl-CoA dehydrogenase
MSISIGIIGAGTMGSGIAEVAALAKYDVCLHDVASSTLVAATNRIAKHFGQAVEKNRISAADADAANRRIRICDIIDGLRACDFVIEAALEDLEVKRDIFKKLDATLSLKTILATNTSSFSIASIAAATNRPSRVIGMHFFNPPPLMKLVEVIAAQQTSQATVDRTMELVELLGKSPVLCKDTPGFIVNRVARPYYGEAFRLLGEGVADVATIDEIARSGAGFKMGPFELMDMIGIDINFAVTQSVYEQFFHEPRFRPHPIQRQMVEAGTLGRKSGKGFYAYDETGARLPHSKKVEKR